MLIKIFITEMKSNAKIVLHYLNYKVCINNGIIFVLNLMSVKFSAEINK